MADSDSFTKRKRSERSKKYIKKYGGNIYRDMGLKGWAKRQELMKNNHQNIVYNTRFVKDKRV